LFLQPEFVVFGPYPQHFGVALRAAFILARNTALVRYACVALGANTLSAFAHCVLEFMFGHFVDLMWLFEENGIR
jgi:hypothetical protein